MTILMLSSTDHAKTPYNEWFPDTAEQMILFCPVEKKTVMQTKIICELKHLNIIR